LCHPSEGGDQTAASNALTTPRSERQATETPAARAPNRVGPSFNCAASAVANQPLAQIVCYSDDLARLDLSYLMAYMAAWQSVGEQGRPALRNEANALVLAVTEQCELQKSGALGRRPSEGEIACIKVQYERERRALVGRLSGNALEEAKLEPEQALAIQRALKSAGFLAATAAIDGVFGPVTRTAMTSWQRSVGMPETGFASKAMLDQLSGTTRRP
jgi:hypothetical protein